MKASCSISEYQIQVIYSDRFTFSLIRFKVFFLIGHHLNNMKTSNKNLNLIKSLTILKLFICIYLQIGRCLLIQRYTDILQHPSISNGNQLHQKLV